MKVLIVANAFPKFSETFIRDHAINLIDNGIEVFVLVDDLDLNQLEALKGFESYDLINKTTTLFKLLPKGGFAKFLNVISIVNSTKMKSVGMSVKKLLSSFLKNGVRNTIYKVHMLDFILKKDISIVHAHYGNNGEKMAFLSEFGIKLFTTFHGYDIRKALESKKPLYRKLIKSKTPVISISEYNSKSLMSLNFNQSKILSLPNGINTDFYKRDTNFGESKAIKLVTVARLSPEKGLAIAIKAIKSILEKDKNLIFEYLIIGEGKSRNDLELLIKDLKLEKVVTLLGAQTSMKIRDTLTKSHLFLLPSLAEALPTVILEAQSAELPILATKVGSVESMVKGGFTVKPDSINDFRDGLLTLIKSRDKWPKMGELGRNHVLENHSISNQTKKLIEFYKTV